MDERRLDRNLQIVPDTGVNDRGDGDARVATAQPQQAAAEFVGQSFGDVRVETPLLTAPGAWLMKGRASKGRRALVQLTPLRPITPNETEARGQLLRSVALATEALGHDPEVKVERHGFEETTGGGGVLYWILPWTGAAERIGQKKVAKAEDLVAATTSLLERLVSRHARGRLDPLLDAGLIVPRTGGADLMGIPIAVPGAWLASAVKPPARAPEERSVDEPRRSGDLWRLGHALRTIASDIEPPLGFDALVDRLTDPDPGRRLGSAADALVALESLQQTIMVKRGDPRGRGSVPSQTGVQERTVLNERRPERDPEGTLEGPSTSKTHRGSDGGGEPARLSEPPIDPAVRPRPPGADEAPTMWIPRNELSPVPQAPENPNIHPMGPKGTLIGVRLPDDAGYLGEGGFVDPRVTSEPAPPTRVFPDPASRHPDEPPREAVPRGDTRVAGAQPNPRAFGPGGTLAGEIPARVPLPPTVGPPGAAPPRALSSSPPSEPTPDPALLWQLQSVQPKRLVLTLIALLLLGVLTAALVELLGEPGEESIFGASGRVEGSGFLGPKTVTPWNDVLLETVPANAQVIGERDGTGLGPSPVRLLVPSEMEVAVLVTAPGYEPVRLVLPTRGRLTVHLTSTGGVLDCPVEVQAPGSQPLEVVGLDLKPTQKKRYDIPGAVVMRSREGHGAWLVRCGTYGGQRRHRFVSRARSQTVDVQVLRPESAQLSVAGIDVGEAPAESTVAAGFIRVKAALSEPAADVVRWVPAFADMRVQLPRPIPNKRAKSAPAPSAP